MSMEIRRVKEILHGNREPTTAEVARLLGQALGVRGDTVYWLEQVLEACWDLFDGPREEALEDLREANEEIESLEQDIAKLENDNRELRRVLGEVTR